MDGIALIFIAYLVGSISFATLFCRWLKLGDPRQMGSGNPGATNVLRIAGRNTALTVLITDGSKAAIPVLIGHMMGINGLLLGAVALAALVGHCYPIWHRFKGGKGVATFIGGILALDPTVGLLVCCTWLVVALVTRYASLASLLSAMFCPILLAKFSDFSYVFPTCIMVAIIVYRHWNNILRLKAKKEDKIKFSRSDAPPNDHGANDQDNHDKQQSTDHQPETQNATIDSQSAEPLDTTNQDSPQHSKGSPHKHHKQDDR